MSVSPSSFTCANIGANTVTLTVTDAYGNSSSCSTTVTVQDQVAPIALCQNITVPLNASGSATITAAQIDNGSYDVCGGAVTLSVSPSTFTCANIGASNVVTLTVTDIYGNASTCTANVTVIDNLPPVALCQNVTIQLDATGNASIVAADINNGSTDNCGIFFIGVTPNTFTCADVGVNTVTLGVIDNYGNNASCTATVTVQDNLIPPTITCPSNVAVNTDAGVCGAVVNFEPINTITFSESFVQGQVSPHCGEWQSFRSQLLSSLSYTKLTIKGSLDPIGVSVTDPAKVLQIANALRTGTGVSISDNGRNWQVGNCGSDGTGPAIELSAAGSICACPNAEYIVRPCIDVAGGSNPNWGGAGTDTCNGPSQTLTVVFELGAISSGITATDNCSYVITQTAGLPSGSLFPVGTTTNTFVATDPSGNTDTCSFTVTVTDMEAPTAICQNINLPLNAAGTASITADLIDNGSNDACGIASLAVSPSSFTCANVGANTVTLTVTDNNGNISTCAATVTVQDVTPPVAVCQPLTVQLDAMGAVSITAAQINNGSNDACGIASLAVSPSSFSCSNVGPNTVTLTVTDVNGLVSTCQSIVTVQDITPPVALCQPLTVQLDAMGTVSITGAQINFGSSDACGIASLVASPSNFTCANVGTNTVTLTVTDNNGNISTCSTTVTVEDNIAPTITCPADIVVPTSDGLCVACEETLPVIATPVTINFVDRFITYTGVSINGGGNAAVVAPGSSVSLAYNMNVAFNSSTGYCPGCVVQSYIGIGGTTQTLQCESNISNGYSNSYSSGNFTAPMTPGLYYLTQSGTLDYVCQPQNFNNLPANAIGVLRVGALTVFPVATATDNCGVASVVSDHTGCYPVGLTTVTWTATDVNGNVSTCQSTVTVEDVTPPEAICQNITVELDAMGSVSITASQIDNGSNDACGILSLEVSPSTFDCDAVGDNTVTLTVTDNNGNVSTCTAIVTVEDNIPPTITCPANLLVNTDLDVCGAFVNVPLPIVFDNCMDVCADDIVNSGSTIGGPLWDRPVGSGPIISGLGPVTYSAFTFTVTTAGLYNINSVQNFDGYIHLYENTFNPLDQFTNLLGGNDDYVYIGQSQLFDMSLSAGTSYILVTSGFAAGEEGNFVSTISMNCVTPPPSPLRKALVYEGYNGLKNIEAAKTAWLLENKVEFAPLPAKNEMRRGMVAVVNDYNGTSDATDDYPVGTTTVTFTATDPSGNTAMCSFDVIVTDNEAPEAICQDIVVELSASGTASITAAMVDNGSNDACGIASMSVSPSTFTCANVGPNTVTLTVTDNNGNVSTCTSTVSVEDNVAPVVVCQDVTVVLDDMGNYTLTPMELYGVGQVINISSDNGIGGEGLTSFTVGVTSATTVTFDWNYTTVDGALWDTFGYMLNGSYTQLTNSSGSDNQVGSQSVVLSPGDIFGFRTRSVDNIAGACTVIVSNFTPGFTGQFAPSNWNLTLDNSDGTAYFQTTAPSDACGIASVTVSPNTFTCADAQLPETSLYFSEYIEGSSNNKALEIFNPTPTTINLSGYVLKMYFNGNTTSTSFSLSGSIASGDTFVVANSSANAGILALADLTLSGGWYNGDDAIVLEDNSGNVLDIFGRIGEDPGSEWSLAGNTTQDNTLRRVPSVIKGVKVNPVSGFPTLGTEWVQYPIDDIADLGNHVANPVLGGVLVTLTATDVNGNVSTCMSTVTVQDLTPPVAICQDIIVQLDAMGALSITGSMVDDGSNDACGIQSLVVSPNAFTCANVGPNPVTLTVTDNNGNVSTCQSTVTVEDNVPPVALCQNLTVQLNAMGNVSITAAQVNNGSTDACGIASLSVSQSSFTCANVGPNTVTLTVTDVNGNVSTCESIVTVQDVTPPVALCQNITVQLDAMGTASITASQIDAGSTDACGILSMTVLPNTFNCFNVGLNPVTLTVTDVNGNVSTCNATVAVEDNVAPVVVCSPITVQLDAAGEASINTSNFQSVLTISGDNLSGNPGFTDFKVNIIQGMTVSFDWHYTTLDGPTFDTFGYLLNGAYTELTHVNNGNTQNGTASVLVAPGDVFGFRSYSLDNVFGASVTTVNNFYPSFSGQFNPNNWSLTLVNSDGSAYFQPIATDACGIDSIVLDIDEFSCENLGENTVTVIATDVNGNVGTCSAIVTVVDSLAPVPDVMNLPLLADHCQVVAPIHTATDNCAGTVIGVPNVVFPITSPGTVLVTWTYDDGNGNISTQTQLVTVFNTPAPNAGVLSGIQAICVGGTTTFVSSGDIGGTWLSSAPGVATVDALGFITGVSVGTASITYTVTGIGGCVDSVATRDVIVTAPANAGELSGTQAICIGGTSLFSSTSMGGTWMSSNPSVADVNASSGLVVGFSAGTATITYTVLGTGGCANATATRDVTVTAPGFAGVISGVQNICALGTTQFTTTGTGGTWSSSNMSVATVDATGLVTGLTAGTATITYTVAAAGGCPAVIATRDVIVTAPANAGVLSGVQAVCSGSTTIFITDGDMGGMWSSSNTAVANVDSVSGVITGVSAGTATITYTIAAQGGCPSAFATLLVTVNATPEDPNGASYQTFCATSNATLADLEVTADGGSSGMNTLHYYASVADYLAGNELLITTPLYDGMTVVISQSTPEGCESIDLLTVLVTLTPAPVAPVAPAVQLFCSVDQMTIGDLAITALAGYSITWYDAAVGGNVLSTGTVLTTGTYFASQTSPAGCESIERVLINVTVTPTPGAPTGLATQTFCASAYPTVANLVAVATAPNTVITWYNSAGVVLMLNTPLQNGMHYYATQTSAAAPYCESVAKLDVTVVLETVVVPTGIAHQDFCVGDYATVGSLVVNVAAGNTYVWYSAPTGGSLLSSSTLLQDGNYYAQAVNANGCTSLTRFAVQVTLDPDCDNDGVLDVEEVDGDTDGDEIVDYLDNDDDGDGILTIDEDSNNNGDWFDDDCNTNGVVDYLDPQSCDFIPNAFSPNGDAYNSVWEIPALVQYPDFTLEVYDRWGNIVYEYSNAGRPSPVWWDGISNGRWNYKKNEVLPTGTYFYIINYNKGTKSPDTGWVYLQNNN